MNTASTTQRPAKARLDYGIDRFNEPGMDEFDRRLTLHWQVANPWTEQAIMPPYSKGDLDYIPFLPELDRDAPRRLQAAQLIASQHEERHWFWFHPLCTECRGDAEETHRSLVRWMALNPGKAVPLGDDALPSPASADSPDVSPFLTMADLQSLPPAKMHIGEVLPYGAHGIVSGRDGTYKTFLCIDFMLHLASYGDWQGRDSHGGRVLYLAGEGVHQFGRRFAAWQAANDFELDEDEQANVVVRNGTVDLHGGAAEYAGLLAKVKEYRPLLIVIDTLQRSAGGADQNSAADMAIITERVAQLRAAAGEGCTTIMVAHTDKGDNDTRGSSSIEDDADFVLHCKREGASGLAVKVAKMKDGPSGQTIDLAVREVAGSLAIVARKDGPPEETPEVTAYDKVKAVLRHHGRTLDPMPQTEILRQLPEFGGDFDRSTVSRALTKLVNDGVVEQIGGSGRLSKYRIHKDHVAAGDKRTAKGDH